MLGQAAGFSLTQIAQMLGASGAPRIDRAQLGQQAEELVDRKIREMTALRNGLRHVISCTAPSHLECPTFQRLMRIGTARHERAVSKKGRG